jgi:hypothetical protein
MKPHLLAFCLTIATVSAQTVDVWPDDALAWLRKIGMR